MFKRIFLFVIVNIMVIATISITLNLLGVRPYLSSQGIDFGALLIFCAMFGFIGAFISLAMSRSMAKWMMNIQLINPDTVSDPNAKFIVDLVHSFARQEGIDVMPEVGIYDSPEVNAFATGPSKNKSLVAVSTGLLSRMDREAIEGVLAHEMAHITNGDMVTMTLVQGVINTFVMFFARIAAWVVANFVRDEEEGISHFLHFFLVILFDIVFSILGSIVVCYYSRIREYAADNGGARLAGSGKMIHALESLKSTINLVDNSQKSLNTLKISDKPSGFLSLFSTHPRLEERIARLKGAAH